MGDKKKKQAEAKQEDVQQEQPEQEQPVAGALENESDLKASDLQERLDAERDAHMRLAAEYDNFRKRSQKEKDQSYSNGKADTAAKLLPVYDDLQRALLQETADAAYKMGVDMTMNELCKIFKDLGIEAFGAPGDTFDPNFHNAVMHGEDPDKGENEITQVFQQGFKLGDKVIRFAMVQVVN